MTCTKYFLCTYSVAVPDTYVNIINHVSISSIHYVKC